MINGMCFCCLVVITGLTYNQFHTGLMLVLHLGEICSSPLSLGKKKVLDHVLLLTKQIEFLYVNP